MEIACEIDVKKYYGSVLGVGRKMARVIARKTIIVEN